MNRPQTEDMDILSQSQHGDLSLMINTLFLVYTLKSLDVPWILKQYMDSVDEDPL